MLEMARARFVVMKDASLGVLYEIPAMLVVRVPSDDRDRIVYRSKDEDLEIRIERFRDKYGSLRQLYDELVATEGRKIVRSSLKSKYFTISADDGQRKFFARYEAAGTEIRGFSVSYDRDRAETFDRIVLAMSSVFRTSTSANDTLIGMMRDIEKSLYSGAGVRQVKPDR